MAAILKAKSIERTGDGSDVYLRSVLNGSLAIADFFAVMALTGRMFTVNGGLVTTPVTWTATATIDITKPVLFGVVPSDKAIIPVSLWLYMEAYGTNAQFECDAVIGTGGSYTSGGTARTPVNTRSDITAGSGATFYEGGATIVVVGATTKLNRFWRDGEQFAITKTTASATAAVHDPNKWSWSAKNTGEIHVAGPDSQIAIHQGSQAGTGFVSLTYVELPKSWLPT